MIDGRLWAFGAVGALAALGLKRRGSASDVEAMKIVCAWCKKVVKPGVEPASHTICAPCNREQFPIEGTYAELVEELSEIGPGVVAFLMLSGSTRQCGSAASAVAGVLGELGFVVRTDAGAGRYCSHFDLAVHTTDRGWISVDPTAIQFHAPNSEQDALDRALRQRGLDSDALTQAQEDALIRTAFAPTLDWSTNAIRDGIAAFEIAPAPHLADLPIESTGQSTPSDWGYRASSWSDWWQSHVQRAQRLARGQLPRRAGLWEREVARRLATP